MDLISQNKELIGCPKMLERVAGCFGLRVESGWLLILRVGGVGWLT